MAVLELGSGKSTWVRKQLEEVGDMGVCVSRDEIRFSIIEDEEEYFSHEDEVFNKFIDMINNKLVYGKATSIFVDATHLSEKARNKVLNSLYLDDIDIYPVNFNIPLETCLEQNENRKGCGRTYVPRGVIRRMYNQFRPATHGEKYKYKNILNVGDCYGE